MPEYKDKIHSSFCKLLEPYRNELAPYALRLEVWMDGKWRKESGKYLLAEDLESDFAEKNVPDDPAVDGCNQRQYGLRGHIDQQLTNQLNDFRPFRSAK